MSSTNQPVPVSDVMTSPVRTAGPSQAIEEIWRTLVAEHCHHLPIVEDGRAIGMVSTRDLISLAKEQGVERFSELRTNGKKAADIMTTHIETIDSMESVEAAIDRIGCGDIHALVVIDDDEKVVGIVTNHDLLQHLVN